MDSKKLIIETLKCGYNVGDMVLAKVRSYPWWPGEIYNEAFASPEIYHNKKEGYLLVSFYGDQTYGWFNPVKLLPFSSHYKEKSKQMNCQPFLSAVEEAVNEVHKRAALGLVCNCRNPNKFHPTCFKGFVEVDVSDHEPRGMYSTGQIERARDDFVPSETLSFVKQLAMGPWNDVQKNIDWMKNEAKILAYRKVSFEEFDEPYAQAFASRLGGYDVTTTCSIEKKGALIQTPLTTELAGKNQSYVEPRTFEQSHKNGDKYCTQRSMLKGSRFHQFGKGHDLKKNLITDPCSGYAKEEKLTVEMKQVPAMIRSADIQVSGDKKSVKDNTPVKTLAAGSYSMDKKSRFLKCSMKHLNLEKSDLKQIKMKRKQESPSSCLTQSQKCLKTSCTEEFAIKSDVKSSRYSMGYKEVSWINGGSKGTGANDHLSVELPKRPIRSPSRNVPNEKTSKENVKSLHPVLSPLRKRFVGSDSARAGKRYCTFSAPKNMGKERCKGCNNKKVLIREKMANNQKALRIQGGVEKGIVATTSVRTIEDSAREDRNRSKGCRKVLLRFPPESMLPSISELKAKFARFGILVKSDIKVFWKLSACQVIFVNESDARAAYDHAIQNSALFGNKKVNYFLQDLETESCQLSESGNHSSFRSLSVHDSCGEPRSAVLPQLLSHQNAKLKSCLKKNPNRGDPQPP